MLQFSGLELTGFGALNLRGVGLKVLEYPVGSWVGQFALSVGVD